MGLTIRSWAFILGSIPVMSFVDHVKVKMFSFKKKIRSLRMLVDRFLI